MVLCVAEQSQSQCKYYVHVITIINVYSEYRIAILWHTHSSKFTELKDVRHARNHHSQIHVLHVVGMCQKLRMHQTEIQEWKKKTHRKTSQFHAKEPMWSVRFETEPVMDTPDHLPAYAHFARIKAHIDSLIEFAILFHAVYVLLLLLLNIFSSCLNTFLILLKQCEWWREHNAQNWSLACSSLFVIFRFFFSVYNHPSLALCVCLFHSFWVFIHINKWNSMIFIAHHAPLYSCVQKWTHLTPTPSPSSVRRVKIFSQCIVGRRWVYSFFFWSD